MIAPRRVGALWWYHSITKVAIAQLTLALGVTVLACPEELAIYKDEGG